MHMLRQRTLRAPRRARQTGKWLAGKNADQVTDLVGSQIDHLGEPFSRGVERFAEQHGHGFGSARRLLLNSHEHHDHPGGLAALQQASGAELWASTASADVLAAGG